MSVNPDKPTAIVINMPPELKAQVKKAATMHGTSVSKLIRALINQYVKAKKEQIERYDALMEESRLSTSGDED